MVSCNAGAISRKTQLLEAREYIWVEFLRPKCIALSRLTVQVSLLHEVNSWTEKLKSAVMVFTSFDYASQNGIKLQRLDV